MRSGCLTELLRSKTGRQLGSLAFLAILTRFSPCLTTWVVWPRLAVATILVLPRWTAGTASALAGSANADIRTAAPRPRTALRRAVRPKWCPPERACERAKEQTSWSTGVGVRPDGTGPSVCHHATHGRARCGRRPGGASWGRARLRPR